MMFNVYVHVHVYRCMTRYCRLLLHMLLQKSTDLSPHLLAECLGHQDFNVLWAMFDVSIAGGRMCGRTFPGHCIAYQ